MPNLTIIHSRQLQGDASKFTEPLLELLTAQCSAPRIYVEDFSSPRELMDYLDLSGSEVAVFFTKFKWLAEAAEAGFTCSPKRVVFSHDAGQNYLPVASTAYLGAYSSLFARLKADLIVVPDQETARRLSDEGVATYWLPKAAGFAEPASPPPRGYSLGTFGSLYGGRMHAIALLERSGVEVHQFRAPYNDLPRQIALHRAILVCNSVAAYRFPRLKNLQKRWPLVFITPRPSWMVMAKNYEACAAGSLMLADDIAELATLGFESGVNCLLYRDPAEMVEMARWIEARPDETELIAARGQKLVFERHTWALRVEQFLMDLSALGFAPRRDHPAPA